MSTIQTFLKEFTQEAETTRKMLSIVPNDKYDWKPHAKSMTIRSLATHIAELPSWITMTVTTDGLDFAENPYSPVSINSTNELMQYFEKEWQGGKEHLEKTNEDILKKTWVLRNGDQVYSSSSKAEVIRMTYCQIVHHRAQLGVYLRLLDIPIPGSYGPSADEMGL
ncbi:DinB family protein [Polluticoccus soli]|uniref:DinB family protein n=1 Tax=Polluticoccus soli TaxID=3034150 RepID=UPI0023E26065|nr:DinB family protein [Flavipsychrobacter sp. JY13-12]